MIECIFPDRNLMQSYFFYSAMLVLKLLALVPLATIVEDPDKVKKANVNDLKNLTPFWLLAGLYATTAPDMATALMLMRGFVVARVVAAIGYVTKVPKPVTEFAMLASHAITAFMGGWVIYAYRDAL